MNDVPRRKARWSRGHLRTLAWATGIATFLAGVGALGTSPMPETAPQPRDTKGPSAACDRASGHAARGRGRTGDGRAGDLRAGAVGEQLVELVGRRAGPRAPATHRRILMDAEATQRLDVRAMGTTLSTYGPADPFPAGADAVVGTFREEEQRFSRFRSDSELSRVNAGAGRWVSVSEDFSSLLDFSLSQAAATDGAFDPTVLAAVEAAGYDRDFDDVIRSARGALHPPVPCGRWSEIEVRGRSVRLPSGVGLDFGGVAKGWTTDLAAERALKAGMPWVLVSAGGDLRIGGAAPSLAIDIEDPDEPAAPIHDPALKTQVPSRPRAPRSALGARDSIM